MLQDTPAFSGFSVSDQAEAKEFYQNLLGLTVEETDMGLQLKLFGGGTVYVYGKENHEPATYTILNFVVADIDKTVDELGGKGVKFEIYEGLHQDEKGIARGISAHMGPDIAWFKDPSGNILSVLHNE
jgi:catechol 2,3-dioxygenase-like lactoylglutathione lyase family enzyme